MGVLHRFYRLLVMALCGAGAAVAAWVSGGVLQSDGAAHDAAVFARARLAGTPPSPSPAVAVVGLDWASLESDEIRSLPRTLMTPKWAGLIDLLSDAGARVVAFDMVFQFSVNSLVPNYDRPFLAALARHGKILVLARTGDTSPASPFLFAVGARTDPAALGLTELLPESDGAVRAAPEGFPDGRGGLLPGLAAAALIKAGAAFPARPIRFLPDQPMERMIPGFSLIDVLRCADHPELLRKVFADRVVFVGTVLPEEDRKTSSDRFLLAAEASSPPPGGAACALSPLSLSAPATGTVPGVYVHAAAADAVLRNREVRRLPLWGIALLTAASALLASAAGFVLGPGRAVAATGLLLAALFAASVGLLSLRLWMPVSLPGAAAVLAMAAAYAGRYLIEDRRRRQVQDAFGHYVSPTIVRRMVETGTLPRLGGERREVTIMFADLSGFTALSGQIGPEDLMEVTNRYLALVVKAVEATGGYVDKFIGDAVMAMWGAPADDPDHAVNALAAACLAARDVEAERLAALAKGRIGFAIKIGLNSGPATVGNVGSDRRFNYTAVGETVNLASRLEGMPGLYDCAVVVSRSTARAVGKEYLLCELDRVSVKGVAEPLPIFMPIAPRVRASPEHQSFVAVYEAALAAYRGRDFSRAAGLWEALSYPREAGCNVIFGGPGGGPGKIMAARARSFLSGSPGPGWNGVWTVAKG